MRALMILGTLLLGGCGSFKKHSEKDSTNALQASLETQYTDDLKALKEASDQETGWPSVTDCDGLLWAGLSLAGGGPARIELADDGGGHLERRPGKPCYTEKDGDLGSKSSISQDMVTGYLWGAWRSGNLPALQRLASYGEAHSWNLGEGDPARTILRPNGIGLLGRAIFALSKGSDDRSYRHTPSLYLPVQEDYERHLEALGIALNGEVTGGEGLRLDISGGELDRLKDLVQVEPQNPLFQAVLGTYTGDMGPAIELLLADSTPIPTYVRGDNIPAYWLAEKVFAESLVLKHLH